MKTTIKTNIALSLMFILSVALVSFTDANGQNTNDKQELKYVGNLNNKPVFQLELNNTADENYTISVIDIYSNVLYKEQASGTKITRKFLLNTDELGDEPVRVEIASAKTNKKQVFEINRNSRFVQDLVINKVK